MDPISQGVLGAATGGLVGGKKLPRASLLIGFLTGLSADLDVFMPTGDDPTAGWVMHRGYSHALAFIPIGAAICWALFMLAPSLRRDWKRVYLICLAAYATHAPLDALTSYGTQLWLPFSGARAALDWMPIIDPFFTLVMVALVIVGAVRGRPRFASIALAFAGTYFAFGAWQHARAMDAVRRVAERRGHIVEHVRVHPSPGALSLWRGVYLSGGHVWADGVFVPYAGRTRVREGEGRPHLIEASLPMLASSAEARRQFGVFSWFSDGLVVPVEGEAIGLVSDGRFSADPATFAPLWGMDFSGDRPKLYMPPRNFRAGELLRAMVGRDDRYVPLN